MAYEEVPVIFDCQGDELIGIVTRPTALIRSTAVVIVVGGPQFRVGAHRMFVSLARYLAQQGIPSIRFDFRGMGDSTGRQRSFEEVNDDIEAAITRLRLEIPSVSRIVLWGLCDGASAACFFAPNHPLVDGVILLNPWVHSEVGEARTMIRRYYTNRLLEKSFWQKVFTGKFDTLKSAQTLWRSVRVAALGSGNEPEGSTEKVSEKMAISLLDADTPFAVLLSTRDAIAHEYKDHAMQEEHWQRAHSKLGKSMVEIKGADHTLTTSESMIKAFAASVSAVELFERHRDGEIPGNVLRSEAHGQLANHLS